MLRWVPVVLLLAGPLRADLRLVTQKTFGARLQTETQYFKGNLSRWDLDRTSYILDKPHEQVLTLMPDKHEFLRQSAYRGLVFSIDKSHVFVVELDTRDTGERRQQWGHGHTAYHYVTVRRERVEDAAIGNTPWKESSFDSWFLDMPVPEAYHARSAAAGAVYMLGFNNREPALRVTRQGPTPKGILVYENADRSEEKVTDLSEAPLDPKLFEVPADYRRIIARMPGQKLTWDEEIEYYWQQFEDWFGNLFS